MIPPLKLRKPERGRSDVSIAAYSAPGRSAVRHPIIVLVALLLGLGVGGFVALSEVPVWTAQSRTIAGTTLNLTNLAATPGLAVAEAEIASNYSRLVGTPSVTDGVTKRLGHPPRGKLTATPVPQSSIILIEGTGHSQADATALASAGQSALVDAVNVVNRQTAAANTALFNQYQTAAQQLAQDTVNLNNLQQQSSSLQSSINSLQSTLNGLRTPSSNDQAVLAAEQQRLTALTPPLIAATTAVNVDKLTADTLQNQYQANFNPNLQAEQAISPLGAATPNGSNRTTNLEIGVLAGAVGGLVIGIAAASILDIVRDRRALRRSS